MPEAGAKRLAHLEATAVDVARRAAVLVRAQLGRAVEVGIKSSPTDVVTQTDIDTERMILELLSDATPGCGFIGEEGGSLAPDADVVWVIDPLDGTVNFTYGVPLVAVSIAAAVGGELVAGSVVDVVSRDTFHASRGNGAWHDDRRITGSHCARLSDAIVTTGFSYSSEQRRRQGELIAGLLPLVRDIRCFGSAALEMCWVASGRVDAYYERDTKVWDYAASSVIAEEAGMTVELQCPENDQLVLAAPQAIFDELRSRVEQQPLVVDD